AVRVLDPDTGRCEALLLRGPDQSFDGVTIGAEGAVCAVSLFGGGGSIRDVASGEVRASQLLPGLTLFGEGGWTAPPDGRILALATGPRAGPADRIVLWNVETGELRGIAGGCWPSAVAFTPDGRTLLAVAKLGKTVQAWDVASGEELVTLRDGPSGITSLAV